MTEPSVPPTPATTTPARGRRLSRPVVLVAVGVLVIALGGGAALYASRDDSGGASNTSASHGAAMADHASGMQMGSTGRAGRACLTMRDHTDGASASAKDRAKADAFYASVRSGITRFADVAVAERESYRARSASGRPERVQHYFGGGKNGAVLDPEHPSGLVYFVDGDRVTLLGAVWVTQASDPPQPGGSLTVWHDHHACGCPATHPNCPASRGEVGNPPKMLHAWTFAGVVDRFAHDFPGAVGPDHVRGDPLPFQQ